MEDKAPKITTPFINLQSDFGFKRVFGTKKYQNNVIRLLHAALGDDIDIKRIVPYHENTDTQDTLKVLYHDKEVLPAETDGKRIVYDVYFTVKVEKGASMFKQNHLIKDNYNNNIEHHFILEMQNIYNPPFEDRMTFYVAEMISAQGKIGWDYDLDPVVMMAVTDFDFPYLTKQMVQEFELRENNTGETLTKKLRMLFFSLKQVSGSWEECKSELEKSLYLIKNMDKMDKNSKAYTEGGFEEFFEAADSGNVVGEEFVTYSRSLAAMREVQAGLDYRYDQGVEKGKEIGIAEGREDVARKMKAAGIDIDFIANVTELSPERIKEL